MTKQRSTKRALLMSALSLLLCVSMLVGTTYAWFTDEVVSGMNTIQAGNLDVELMANGEEVKADTKLFSKVANWEPGVVVYENLQVVNKGTLALKYRMNLNFGNENDLYGHKLSEVLKVAVIDKIAAGADRATVLAAAKAATNVGSLYDFVVTGELEAGKSSTEQAVVIFWEPNANEVDNLYNANNGKTPSVGEALFIEFGVNLQATQKMSESDSFGKDYDEKVEFATKANNAAELRRALDLGGDVLVTGEMNATDTVDVPTWTNAPAEYVIDATWVKSMTGGTYVLDQASRYGIVARISAGETLAISDMKVTANSQWPVYLANFGGELTISDFEITAEAGAGVYPYGTNGTTTLENVKVNQERLDPAYAATTPWAGTAVAASNGHNLVINSGTYVGSTWAVYGYNSGSTITINGGTFKAPRVVQMDGVWSGSNKSVAIINGGDFDGAIYLDYGTNAPEITINGGNFTNFSATVLGAAKLVITGGTFDADPSAYVASGYVATEVGGIWTVTAA